MLTEVRQKTCIEYDAWEHLCADWFDDPERGLVVLLTVYFDASSNPRSDKRPNALLLHTVGGYVASVEDWRRFRKEWREELAKKGLEFFHMTDFEYAKNEVTNGRALSAKNPYYGWSKEDFVPFLKRLHGVINRRKSDGSYRMEAFISSLVKPDFDKTKLERPDDLSWASYYMFNAASSIGRIAQWADVHDYHDPIHYIFAGGDGEGSNLERWFVAAYKDEKLRRRFRLGKGYSHLPYEIQMMKGEPALQAADIAAFEFNKLALEIAEKGGPDIPLSELRRSLSSLCKADSQGVLLRSEEMADAFPREKRATFNVYYRGSENEGDG
jgi:hypothetical protein